MGIKKKKNSCLKYYLNGFTKCSCTQYFLEDPRRELEKIDSKHSKVNYFPLQQKDVDTPSDN